jgi:type VI secretion system ImpC/EvpB family protein
MITTPVNRISDLLDLAPQDKLAPIATLVDSKLKSCDAAVAEVIRTVIGDSANFVDKHLDEFLAAMIAGLKLRKDRLKSAILGHPETRALESNYAAVEEQVFQQDGQGLRVRVVNVTPQDVRQDLADAGLVEGTRLYQSLVVNEFHRPGGQPNRIVHWLPKVGAQDVDLIKPLLQMADEAHFALITTARPEVVCPVEDPDELPADFQSLPPAIKIRGEFSKLENASLHSLQQDPRSTKWVLIVGQANARCAYDPQANPCPGSPQFKESNGELRVGAGLLVAKSVARSYTANTNGSRIAGVLGGGKQNLPGVIKNGEVMTLDCVIDELQETQLKKCGLMSFLPWKRKDYAVAFDSVSAFVPVMTGDARKDADAVLASKLAYTMLSIEFGHILKRELRYARGLTVDCDTIAAMIEKKLKLFVTPDLKAVSQEALARKPLESVTVTVTMPLPGIFLANATITPHTLLAEAHVKLKIQARD